MLDEGISVSIIIPCYNEEKYIKRCLNSVVNQTLENIEIIIVDDGSTDNTALICDEFKRKYPLKVNVIHQNNAGQGIARNKGISIAKGEYIGFVDADDWVDLTMYEKMYRQAKKYNTDITFCDIRKVVSSKGIQIDERSLSCSEGIIDVGLYLKDGLNNAYSMNRIYKKSIWEKNRYKKMLYEDLELMFKIQSNCSRISYVKEFLCTYFKHSGSTTTSFNNINLLDMIEAYRNAILNSNLKYTNEVSYNIAKRLLRYLNTEGLDVFKAEYIELIQELMPYFENNDYILSDNEVKKILSYSDEQIIPNMICYACFGNNKYNELNNWKIYTKNTHFVKLDEETCDLKLAPDFIKSAYKEGNYRFVGIYYGLKYIFYNGGMFFDERLKLSKPIGHLRDKNDFVLFDGKETGRLLMVGVKKSNKCVAVLMKVIRNSKFINDQFVLNEKLLNIIKDKINIKYKNNDYVL